MIRNISFVISRRNGRLITENIDINLRKLSAKARYLAQCIWTTANDDDYSKVWVKSRLSRMERVRAEWHKTNSETWQYETCEEFEEEAEDYRRRFGSDFWEKHDAIVWTWDALRKNETPYEYLERNASKIFTIGYISSSFLKPEISPADAIEMLVIREIDEIEH